MIRYIKITLVIALGVFLTYWLPIMILVRVAGLR